MYLFVLAYLFAGMLDLLIVDGLNDLILVILIIKYYLDAYILKCSGFQWWITFYAFHRP